MNKMLNRSDNEISRNLQSTNSQQISISNSKKIIHTQTPSNVSNSTQVSKYNQNNNLATGGNNTSRANKSSLEESKNSQ